jgi:predicted Ser/Thr protein kinase
MEDIKSIIVTKGPSGIEIHNPTNYPLIGNGAQGAVFKLSEDKCVKIYTNPLQASMEHEALRAGSHLAFFPKVYETGTNYIVMDYFNAPTLKEYLRNCVYIPESITLKILTILAEMKKANFTMVDAPLRHIFVLENEELKVIDHVNAFKRVHPVPLKLLRDLKMILLKDSFLAEVKRLEPETFREWDSYFQKNNLDYKKMVVSSGGVGSSVKVDSAITQTLIGAGHQGAVYRVSEDKCVKIYGNTLHASQEKEVLTKGQNLSFIPKVFDTGPNYILMEYLAGPDLNAFLKKQATLSIDITKELLNILTTMKKSGFKQIDAPLRHIIITRNGFKMVDHVYSFIRNQVRPLELFKDLHIRGFLDAFLEQTQQLAPKLHAAWTKHPIPLQDDEVAPVEEMIGIEHYDYVHEEQNNNKNGKKEKQKDKGKKEKHYNEESKDRGKKDKHHHKEEGHKKDKHRKEEGHGKHHHKEEGKGRKGDHKEGNHHHKESKGKEGHDSHKGTKGKEGHGGHKGSKGKEGHGGNKGKKEKK